ncbi:hypothetical protein [Streptomyces sp. NPDC002537]
MAKKKITITLDERKVAEVERLVSASSRDEAASTSAWIEDAVTAKLAQAERAQRAVDWLVDRAQAENPGGWDAALAAVKAADERRGFASAEGKHAA